ncbi:MAG: hypothetical protein M0C28_21875 [Candidatus Moduliflexus flocculans]|nr:hypothetical protein [Candidatus Moduliflexus flocculans]
MDRRSGLPYDIDGLVVKGIEIDPRGHGPRPSGEADRLQVLPRGGRLDGPARVEWSESGANFTPIGVTGSRPPGRHDRPAGQPLQHRTSSAPWSLQIGSRVIITKRGEIIPKIESLWWRIPRMPRRSPVPSDCLLLRRRPRRTRARGSTAPTRTARRRPCTAWRSGCPSWTCAISARSSSASSTPPGRVRDDSRSLRPARPRSSPTTTGWADVLARKILRNLAARNEVSLAGVRGGLRHRGHRGARGARRPSARASTASRSSARPASEELAAIDGFAEITGPDPRRRASRALGPEMDAPAGYRGRPDPRRPPAAGPWRARASASPGSSSP